MAKKIIWALVLIIIVLAMMIAINWPLTFWPFVRTNNSVSNNQNSDPVDQNQKIEGIIVQSPDMPEVLSPIKITGKVNGGGWGGFEGRVGSVKLLDNNGNNLGEVPLTAVGEWMQVEVNFDATLTVNSNYKGPATLLFRNENASGEPAMDKFFGLPVIIK